MVAVPEMPVSAPVAVVATGRSAVPAHRRVVAVAVSPMELLRPESDLVRLVEGFDQVDLLVAGEDVAPTGPCPVGVLSARNDGYGTVSGPAAGFDDDDLDDWRESAAEEVRASVARLGLPGLQLHRLGLRPPLTSTAEDDLVAAMSELVGFDPEPGVYCLAPAHAPGDPSRTIVNRAAKRIAQVYGIPLLRYRCLELSVVGQNAP